MSLKLRNLKYVQTLLSHDVKSTGGIKDAFRKTDYE
jgi:hypothetical protein